MVSVDTIRAYTYANININGLVQRGWKKWVNKKDNSISFFKKDGHLLFWCFPAGILLIKFSIPKFFYGTNAKPFNLTDASLVIKLVNYKIKKLLPDIDVDCFENWICTEIHPFVHYYADNEEDKTIYLECLKKTRYPRLKRHNYPTGIQARNGSYALNIYSKVDEIKFRVTNRPHSVSNEDYTIMNNIKYVLRFEYQVKKAYLRYHFRYNRTVKDVLTKQFCENLLLDAVKNANLNSPFLYKSELIERIKSEFGKIKARNLIEFVTDFNERPKDFINIKYPQKTQNNYLGILKKNNINPVYLLDKVSRKIDFTDFNEPDKLNFKISLLKILILITFLKKHLNQQKNIHIESIIASSLFIPPAFYLEDGGG